MAGERMLRIVRMLLHPIAQLRRMNTKVFRRLRIRNPALLDQPDMAATTLTLCRKPFD